MSQPIPTEQSKQRPRIIFIDVLRGYAILMMLQGHVVGLVLDERYRGSQNLFYGVLQYLKGLTAPCFFVAAGMIFSYLMSKQEEAGIAYRWKGVKRGLWLIFMGYLLQLKVSEIANIQTEGWAQAFEFLGKSHVLHTMGWSLILLVGVRQLAKGRAFYILTLGLALGALLFGSWFYLQSYESEMARVFGTFLKAEYALFPLFPWVGFVLVGAALGASGWKNTWFSSPKQLVQLMGLGGGIMMLGAGLMQMELLNAELISASFWRMGEVLIFVALVAWGCHFLQQKNKLGDSDLEKGGWRNFFYIFFPRDPSLRRNYQCRNE